MTADRTARWRVTAMTMVALTAVGVIAGPWLTARAQEIASDRRFGGLEWTFVRIKYSSWNSDGFRARYWSEPWAIDGPAAEQNLSRRLKSVTAIRVNDPIVLTLTDPQLFQYPWIYFVEPGNLKLKDEEVPILREFLLRGGTATLDDFHGPIEWENVVREFKRVFPEREIVDLPPEHPVFSCFYKIDAYPQIPGLGSYLRRPHVGEGRVHRAPAHHPRRQRAADADDQLEHRHGRWLGMVER